MTISKRLAAHRLAASAELQAGATGEDDDLPPDELDDDSEEDETTTSTSTKKEKKMADNTVSAEDLAAAVATAKAEAGARYATVLASEHYAGRESLAADMLANDKLSADEIVGFLAKAGAPAAGADDNTVKLAAEDAARAEMKSQIAATGNSDIEAVAPSKAAADDNSLVASMKARFPSTK